MDPGSAKTSRTTKSNSTSNQLKSPAGTRSKVKTGAAKDKKVNLSSKKKNGAVATSSFGKSDKTSAKKSNTGLKAEKREPQSLKRKMRGTVSDEALPRGARATPGQRALANRP